MTQAVRVTDADKQRWDRLVSESPDSTYAHSWSWLELYRRHLQGEMMALALEEDGRFRGAFGGFLTDTPAFKHVPLLHNLKTLWSPHELTWDYGGPCFLPKSARHDIGEILEAVQSEARRQGAWSLRISPFSLRIRKMLKQEGFERRERLTSVVSLKEPENFIWRRIHKSFRRDVGKAMELGLIAEIGQGPAILAEALPILSAMAEEKGFEIPPYPFMHELFGQNDRLLKVHWEVVRNADGKLLAFGILLGHKRMITTRWGLATLKGKAEGANHLRLWHAMTWARKNGYSLFDAGGIPSNPRNGIHEFKRKLGGTIRPVDWFVRNIRFGSLARLSRYTNALRVLRG